MLERDSEMEETAVEKREKIILKDLWCAVALDNAVQGICLYIKLFIKH